MAVVWRPPNRTLVNLSLYPCLPSGTDLKQNHPHCHSSPPSQDENIPTKTSDGVFLNFTTSTCSKSGAPSRAHHTTGAPPRPNTLLALNYRAHHATITIPDHDAAYGGTTQGFRPPTGRAAHPAQHGAWGPRMVSETGRTGHVRRSRSGPKYRDLKPRERGRHQQVARFPWDSIPMVWLTWDRQRRRVRWSTCRGCASGPCQVRGMLYKKPIPQRPRTWPGNGRRAWGRCRRKNES